MLYPQHIHHYVSYILRRVWINLTIKIELYGLWFGFTAYYSFFRLVWNHIHSSGHLPRRDFSFQNNHSWKLSGWRLSGKKNLIIANCSLNYLKLVIAFVALKHILFHFREYFSIIRFSILLLNNMHRLKWMSVVVFWKSGVATLIIFGKYCCIHGELFTKLIPVIHLTKKQQTCKYIKNLIRCIENRNYEKHFSVLLISFLRFQIRYFGKIWRTRSIQTTS